VITFNLVANLYFWIWLALKKLLLSIWLVLTFTTHLFAETCETNPGNCTPVQLCEKSTEVVADKTYWIGDETNSYLKVARQFGLDCGAMDALPTCQRDANTCAILELCEVATATKGSKTTWNLNFESHVKLAKSFGLNCEVSKAPDVEAVSTPTVLTPCDKNPAACISEALCKKAADTSSEQVKWRVDTALAYVEEAKKRKLDCTVKVTEPFKLKIKKPEVPQKLPKSASLTPCDKNPAACISEMLCEKAAETSNGKVEWRSQTVPKYVAEAKKRKLDCQPKIIEPEKTKIVPEIKDKDIPAETGTSNKQLENLFEKKDFQKLRIGERKQLQYGLKKLGYYKGAIDGLYGPMSQNAVRKYVQDKELLDGYPVSVLEALVAELGVGKYFTKPDKFSLTSYQIAKKPNTRLIPRTIDRTRAFIDVDGDGVDEVFEAKTNYNFDETPKSATKSDFTFYQVKNGVSSFKKDLKLLDGRRKGCIAPRKAVVGDFNADNIPDLFVACTGFDKDPFPGEKNKLVLSKENGKYEIRDASNEVGFFHGAAAADFNNDGYSDVIVSGHRNGSPTKLWLNNGAAGFGISSSSLPNLIKSNQSGFFTVDVPDVDGDGHFDIFLGGHEWNPLTPSYVFFNDGKQQFNSLDKLIIPPIFGQGVVLDVLVTEGRQERLLWVLRTSGGNGSFYKGVAIQKYGLKTKRSELIYQNSKLKWWREIVPENKDGKVQIRNTSKELKQIDGQYQKSFLISE
jgi:hypothetical protein